MRALAVAALVTALPPIAAAQTPAVSDLDRGIALRREGRPAEAIPSLRAATQAHPDDPDAWLNLGLAYATSGRLDEADKALARASQLAPDYADVQIARARVAYFRQDPAEAARRLAPVLAARPDNAEAKDLATQIAQARNAGVAPWRLDATYTRGRLGRGLPVAETEALALTHRAVDGHLFGLSVDRSRQFGQIETYGEVTLANRRAYLALGGAPNAQFRPEWSLRGGLYADALRYGGWTVQPMVDAGWSRYRVGDVRALTPGIDVQRGDALLLNLRWINVLDETDTYRTGYSLRGQWRPAASAVALEAGWADAPESSEGRTVRVKTTSLGLAWDVSPDTTLRLSGNHQGRRAYDRNDVTVGVTRRF